MNPLSSRNDQPVEVKIGENLQLVTDEPVGFEKEPVEVQDCRKITDHFRGICRIYPNLMKENRRMWTCNRLDLETLGSQPINMPKNLLNHWVEVHQDFTWFNRSVLEESIEYTSNEWKHLQNRKMSTCNQLDLESRGSWPTMAKNFTVVGPHCGASLVESVEHMFFSHPLAQQVWHYIANIIWQFFAKRGNLGPHKFLFQWSNVFLIDLVAKHWNCSVVFGFFLEECSPVDYASLA